MTELSDDLDLIFERLKNGEIERDRNDIPLIFQQVVIQSLLEKGKFNLFF